MFMSGFYTFFAYLFKSAALTLANIADIEILPFYYCIFLLPSSKIGFKCKGDRAHWTVNHTCT